MNGDNRQYIIRIFVFFFTLILLAGTEGLANENVEIEKEAKIKVEENYGKLPLYFIQNNGQLDEKVKFYEKGSGHSTFFTKDGVYFYLPSINSGEGQSGGEARLIELSFLNANSNPEIIAVEQQEGKVNYFTGNDPNKWKSNISTYKAVIYKEVYPGIDIKFYGNNRQMEYDIIVKAGADPSSVQFKYDGIEGLRVAENGDLEITIASPNSLNGKVSSDGDKILQKRPFIYQEIEGEKSEIIGKFIILNNDKADTVGLKSTSYAIEIASSYNKKLPLIIDPAIVYSTYLGGGIDDWANKMTVDASGNIYITGGTSSSDFPIVSPIYSTLNGIDDVFITKINSSGSAIIYSTFLGGGSSEIGLDIYVDYSGVVYITGQTASSDFPTVSPIDSTLGGITDAFITKINSLGNSIVYSSYIGGGGDESGYGLAVDYFGSAYLTGRTTSSDFPTVLPIDSTLGGTVDAFVTNLNAAGSGILFSTYLGGGGNDWGNDIKLDTPGNVRIVGQTSSTDFPTVLPIDSTLGGTSDAFISIIVPGVGLTYSTYLGGSDMESGNNIIVELYGDMYVSGDTWSSDFPTVSPADSTLGGARDGFITKLNWDGSSIIYSTYLGGGSAEYLNDMKIDSVGNVCVAGHTLSSDFPLSYPIDSTLNGLFDIFVTKLNSSGNAYLFSTYLGGGDIDSARAMTVDSFGNIYITGTTKSSDFPTVTPLDATLAGVGTNDSFVVKISSDSDNDGISDSSDNCPVVFNPGQEDSDADNTSLVPITDGFGDACDNCPKTLNSLQTDTDNDGQGNSCDPSPTDGGGATFPSLSPVTKSPGEPIWVSVVVDQFSSSAVDTIKPDCFNTLFEVRDSLSNILPLRYRHRFAYGIPNDVMKIEAGDQVTVTCDLSEMYDPTILVPGSYTVDATYSNYIQDPCDAQPCFDLWMGALQTNTSLSLTISGSTINKKDADITFSPQDWNAQWAFQSTGSGTVSAQISNIPGYSVSNINPSTIRLNGTVPIITGSNSISGSVLTVQFDRTLAIQSQGTVFPGNTVYPTIQGGFTTTSADIFSGEGKVNITGTPSSITAIEICDGVDNDLDGLIDENYPGGNTLCGISVPLAPSNLTFSFTKVTWSGNTTVTTTGTGPAPPSGFKIGTSSYYNISSTAYYDIVNICINYNEANYGSERLKLFHYNGSTWNNITTSLNTATNVICGNTTSFSPFIVAEETSTAVTLSNLSFRQNGEDVVLIWSTSSETDNEGFTILRGETVNGPFIPITSSMIPAIGGLGMKAKYTYTDTNTEAGKTYYYRLQDIDSRAVITLHNILQVLVKADDAVESTKVSQNNIVNDKKGKEVSIREDELQQVKQPKQKTTLLTTGTPVNKTEVRRQYDATGETNNEVTQAEVQSNEPMEVTAKPEPKSHEIYLRKVAEDSKPVSAAKGDPGVDSTFYVSIEDSNGNLLKISKVSLNKNDNASGVSDKLDVRIEDGNTVIRWKESGKEVKALKGYALLRSEKGKGKYTAVSGIIPYFGHNSTDRYTYSFTDNSSKKGVQYEYKLELISSNSSNKQEKLSMNKTGQVREIKQ